MQAKPQNFHAPSFIDGNNPHKMLDHLLSTNHRSGLTLCFSSKKRVWEVVWSICCSWNSCRNNYRTSTLKADPKHQSFFCYPKKCWNKRRSDLEKCQPPKKTANIILDELRSSVVFHARIVVVLGFEANFFLGGNQDWRWKKPKVLRPSNGVVEASDYLTDKHDWLQ